MFYPGVPFPRAVAAAHWIVEHIKIIGCLFAIMAFVMIFSVIYLIIVRPEGHSASSLEEPASAYDYK